MAMTVTLTWDDSDEHNDERAREFVRLHASRMEWGYLNDTDRDALDAVLTWATVSPAEPRSPAETPAPS